jgi:AraC-like DNA-binding protein
MILPGLASLEPVLALDFANPVLVKDPDGRIQNFSPISIAGPRTYRKFQVHLRGPMNSFGIFFRPLGLQTLFGIPHSLLVDGGFAGFEVLGSGIRQLWERMGEIDSFADRVRLADEYLGNPAQKAREPSVVGNIACHLFEGNGAMGVGTLAGHAGLSVRQFERRFRNEIGIAPKLFARIARYQVALDAKIASPGLSWLTIAHQFGYHDQMHMIRDFQMLGGNSPGGILSEVGDMRPEDLTDSVY